MFQHFISLGWYCGVAASLSKYGLRGFSGPFDWYFSDFEGVVHFLETDFEDFLCKENLFTSEDNKKEFCDRKYGCRYIHDVDKDFEQEYHKIYVKYSRRIERFRIVTKEKCCFIRAVQDEQELEFILRNAERISAIIKKNNKNNEIVYLIPELIQVPSQINEKYFTLKIDKYKRGYGYVLRHLFESNSELINFLTHNYDENVRKDNLIFDLKKELGRLEILEQRHQLLLKILKTDYEAMQLPDKIIIYGAGDNGKTFYEMIKNKCNVVCFIDSAPKSNDYKGVPIVNIQEYNFEEEILIVVTPIYAQDEIRECIKRICGNDKVRMVSLEEMLRSKI